MGQNRCLHTITSEFFLDALTSWFNLFLFYTYFLYNVSILYIWMSRHFDFTLEHKFLTTHSWNGVDWIPLNRMGRHLLAIRAHCGSVVMDLFNTHLESTTEHAQVQNLYRKFKKLSWTMFSSYRRGWNNLSNVLTSLVVDRVTQQFCLLEI